MPNTRQNRRTLPITSMRTDVIVAFKTKQVMKRQKAKNIPTASVWRTVCTVPNGFPKAMGKWENVVAVAGNLLLFALVFGMSATVDVRSMRSQMKNYKAIFTGMFCQFIVLPMLGFLVARFMMLDYSTGITLLVVTSSPGGSYSNWYVGVYVCSICRAIGCVLT